MTKYGLLITPTPCVQWLDALYPLGLRIYAQCARALTYLLTYTVGSSLGVYETGDISETVEDRAKVSLQSTA